MTLVLTFILMASFQGKDTEDKKSSVYSLGLAVRVYEPSAASFDFSFDFHGCVLTLRKDGERLTGLSLGLGLAVGVQSVSLASSNSGLDFHAGGFLLSLKGSDG